ncbi:MAG: hypothetical protein L3K17_09890 [Thermoplasmata archaeon]|nr:hypothetical protein [Thermoplasmata archaeon]
MEPPRPVRIPRRSRSAAGSASGPSAEARENVGGRQRATRWFAVFLLGLGVLYAFFIALEASSAGGLTGSPLAVGLFTILALAFVVWGWSITLRRAPRRVGVGSEEIAVEERRGHVRRFRIGPTLETTVLQRYPPSPFSPAATELVRVGPADGYRRVYLVERGMFESPPPGA